MPVNRTGPALGAGASVPGATDEAVAVGGVAATAAAVDDAEPAGGSWAEGSMCCAPHAPAAIKSNRRKLAGRSRLIIAARILRRGASLSTKPEHRPVAKARNGPE